MLHQSPITSNSMNISEWMTQQSQQDVLRLITCGSVDDGKSTLIGRLLWESQQVYEDQLVALQADSKRHGTQGEDIDFALLVDGLAAEREQGITIDVAYRFFSTVQRKFIIADTPGHEQYTRNMITGASTADVAIILVNAQQGILNQTRRHAYLVSLVGIKQVILAVNKMDLVAFDEVIYRNIEETFRQFTQSFGFENITAIPLSALQGDNMVAHSAQTLWYQGPTLMEHLETVTINTTNNQPFIFPIQWVNRPHADFRGFSGSIASGNIYLGQEIRVMASGQTATVAEIVTFNEKLAEAHDGDAITLILDREIDASRGDVFTLKDERLEMTDQFEATLVWMYEDAGLIGRSYDIKLATQWAGAAITSIKYRTNVDTLAHESCRQLQLNDICLCTIATSKPLSCSSYQQSTVMGSFILVDRFTQATVAAGMIQHSLRRAQNVHRQILSIGRAERERLNGHQGKVIWFTGLSGSGKSTLANALEKALHAQGKRTYILDGDNIRQGLNKDLGFTEADRVENIRRIAEVAKLMLDAGLIVLTAFISPFRQEREMARALIGEDNFIEVYVNASLDVCEQRDTKGLYKKARNGELPNMTGVNSPYEPPINPDVVVNVSENLVEISTNQLLENIAHLGI